MFKMLDWYKFLSRDAMLGQYILCRFVS